MNNKFFVTVAVCCLYQATAIAVSRQVDSLLSAAKRGDVPTIKRILEHGTNVNSVGRYHGMTALMAAVNGCQGGAIDLLLENDASANQADRGGDTAITRAVNLCNRNALPFNTLYALVRQAQREKSLVVIRRKSPEKILEELRVEAEGSPFRQKKVELLEQAIEAVEDEKRLTIAKAILKDNDTIPPVIGNTIVSYVCSSAYQETPQEQAETLLKFLPLHQEQEEALQKLPATEKRKATASASIKVVQTKHKRHRVR